MKRLLLFITTFIFVQTILAQNEIPLTFSYDSIINKISYERVYEFPGKTSEELISAAQKTIISADYDLIFSDKKDVFGNAETVILYKRGGNNLFMTLIFKVRFSAREGKIKFLASNFVIRPREWDSKASNTQWASGYSTSKIKTPLDKALEVHYPYKIAPKHKLFQNVELKINDLERILKLNVNADDVEW